MPDDEPRDLDLMRKPSRKSHWSRRVAARSFKIAGDTFKAFLGDKANDLQGNLHNLGESVRGEAGDEGVEVLLLQYDPRWLDLQTRVAVTRELTRLVPEIMQPSGWSHMVRVPLVRAQELLQILDQELHNRPAWRASIRDCEGHLRNLDSAAQALQQLAVQGRQSGESFDRAQIEKLRGEATMALDYAFVTLQRLVNARDDYAMQAAAAPGEAGT